MRPKACPSTPGGAGIELTLSRKAGAVSSWKRTRSCCCTPGPRAGRKRPRTRTSRSDHASDLAGTVLEGGNILEGGEHTGFDFRNSKNLR